MASGDALKGRKLKQPTLKTLPRPGGGTDRSIGLEMSGKFDYTHRF